jgi:DNA-binding MarR family transcriptional regulator
MKTAPHDIDRRLCAAVAETCTASALRKAARAVSNLFDAEMRRTGIRTSQFSLLVALELAGEATVSRLAEVLALDRTTMTRNLGPLERQGLVASVEGHDRRNRVLRLTEKGRKTLARALPVWERVQAGVVRGLGEVQWKGLLQGLKAAVSMARSA